MKPEEGLSGRVVKGTDAAGQVKEGRGNQGLIRAEMSTRGGWARQGSAGSRHAVPLYTAQRGNQSITLRAPGPLGTRSASSLTPQPQHLQSTRHPTPKVTANELVGVAAG